MKHTKKLIALLLALLFVLSLCACKDKESSGSDSDTSATEAAQAPATTAANATEAPAAQTATEAAQTPTTASSGAPTNGYVGTYNAFGMSMDKLSEYIYDLGDESSTITLNADGTGSMTIDISGAQGSFDKWTVSGETLTLTGEETSFTAPIKNGVIELHFDDAAATVYYAREGTDISSYDVITKEKILDMLKDSV